MTILDKRNLPDEVLARLAAHEDLATDVLVVQRGRLTEARAFARTDEMRLDENGNPEFEGYATTYDHTYRVGGTYGWDETIVGGACTKSVAERDDTRLLLNHDGVPMARVNKRVNTLTLKSDDTGLFCSSTLDAASPLVQTVASAMRRGDLDEMSFAFKVIRQEWNNDYTVRRIIEVQLFDVSIVTYPANEATVAALRSLGVAPGPAKNEPVASRSLALALAEDDQLILRRR